MNKQQETQINWQDSEGILKNAKIVITEKKGRFWALASIDFHDKKETFALRPESTLEKAKQAAQDWARVSYWSYRLLM